MLPEDKEFILIITTTNDQEEARHLASLLVGGKTAACVSISSAVISVYRWQGKIEHEDEFMLYIKTTKENYSKVEKIIQENHHYEVPEIIAIPLVNGEMSYLRWIAENTAR